MRYNLFNEKSVKVFSAETLQEIGDFVFNQPEKTRSSFYAMDSEPCFYPYHVFRKARGDNYLTGYQFESLQKAKDAMKKFSSELIE